jgi:2-dehydropantoate 2-reductase
MKDIFDKAKINYEISDNILKKMWWKYMTNIGLNQTTAILKAPYRVLQEIAYAQELAKEAMRETVLISQAINVNLSEEDIDRAMEMLKQLDPDGKTSMMQDIEAKRKTEVEMFSGKLCQMGDSMKIPTPINRMLYNFIRTIEETY